MSVWVPLIGLLVIGAGAQWVAGNVRMGKAQTWAQWAAGALAVVCYLSAGALATRTWIGRDAVPAVAGIHPYVAVAAGLLAIVAVIMVALVITPDRWSTIAASGVVLGLVFLAPSLVGYLPAGNVPDLARSSLDLMLRTADQITGSWFA